MNSYETFSIKEKHSVLHSRRFENFDEASQRIFLFEICSALNRFMVSGQSLHVTRCLEMEYARVSTAYKIISQQRDPSSIAAAKATAICAIDTMLALSETKLHY